MAVDINQIREKYKQLQEKKGYEGDVPWIELKQGDNLVRFLSDDEGNFYHESGYHYVMQGKDKVAVVCNQLNSNEDCYLCDVTKSLYKTKDKADKELAKNIGARPRVFFNILDREDGNKLKVLSAGNMIFKELLKYFADEDWGDLTDTVSGHDVVINKNGEGLDTEYTVMPKPKATKVGSEEYELFDLSTIAHPFTNDEQDQVLEGVSTEEIFKRREAAEGTEGKKSDITTDKKEKKEIKKSAKKELTVEEQFADKIAQIDQDIPKAVKALNNWLSDDDRTEDELDELITKFGKEPDEPAAPIKSPERKPNKAAEKPSESSDDDGLDKEVQEALARFRSKTKK